MNVVVSNPSYYSAIGNRIAEYSQREQASLQDTYTYLFKRMFYVFGVNVYQLTDQRTPELLLAALHQHGHLDRLYSLILAELTLPDNY